MTNSPSDIGTLKRYSMEIRVRYHEVDGQRRVHHGQYLNYFERGRVELLRSGGISYKELEEAGWLLVIRNINVTYHMPAEFDDLLELEVETVSAKGARIVHEYKLTRGEQLVVTAVSEIACLRKDGKVSRLPPQLQLRTETH